MSCSRAAVFSTHSVRRCSRRPSLSLARLLLILCLGAHAFGQTFQYSRGWTNGRKRAFATPSVADAPKEMMITSESPSEKEGGEMAEDGATKRWIFPEGRLVSLGPMDKGMLAALLTMLGNDDKALAGEEEDGIESLKLKGVDLGGRRKLGWRWNTSSDRFLRRRRRDEEQREESTIDTFN